MSITLYICGNGLDLHHRIPSAYKNYRKFLLDMRPNSSTYREVNLVDFFDELVGDELSPEDAWKNVEGALNLDYCSIFERLVSNSYPETDSRMGDDPFYDDVEQEIANRFSYISEFVGRSFNAWVNDLNIREYISNADLRFEHDALFLTFNYTKTLEEFYHVADDKILHVHGKVGGALQFGSSRINVRQIDGNISALYSHDEMYELAISGAQDDFKSHVAACFKNVRANYAAVNNHIENRDIDNVVIMGASISEDDLPYYTDILLPRFRHLRWTFMCYSDGDRLMYDNFASENNIENRHFEPWPHQAD